ncbi:oligosaccharide repeat unit polymerase [Mesonia sp. HuA40]|uniref:oligosaccharide repeat unit polymerase n=1 Tax=Mesonia sp. HuA40 TaxID=2602761 RepID=UPI0011CB0E8D|nr:oligosaccharide repeat unit polymerase [Mesonia sp. HuA40]TXK72558.1 oligosaccharide repeat unit polymerase [Mesonia sp. HuA40]
MNSNNKISISPFPTVRVFLLIYLLINLIGIINFPIYNDNLDDTKVIYLFLIGLFFFFFSAIFFRTIKFRISDKSLNYDKHKIIKVLFIIINSITVISIIYTNIRNGQIIIFSEDARFNPAVITGLFVYISIVITLAYYASILLENKKIKKRHFFFLAFQALLFLSLGYRSPLVTLLGGFFMVFYTVRNDYQDNLKKIFSFKIFLGAFLFLALMSSIATFRVSRKYDVSKYYRSIDKEVLDNNSYLKPIVPTMALFRYDQQIVSILIKEKEGDPMYLGLAAANVLTLLPGTQWAARNIIGDIVGARERPDGVPWSITPTLQGALFVDGGYLFVGLGFFLAALLMETLRKLIIKRKNPFIIALYGIVAVALLKCIHTGYVDIPFFFIVTSLFILKFFVYNVSFKKLKESSKRFI